MSQRSWVRLPQAALHPSALRRLPRAFPGAQPDSVAGSQPEKVPCTLGSAVLWSQSRAKGRRKIACGQRCLEKHQASWSGGRPSAPVAQGPSLPVASRPEEEPPGGDRPQACGQGAPGRLVTPEVRAARRARQGAATASCRSDLAIDKNMTTAGRSTSSTCVFFFFLCELHIGTSKSFTL